MKLDKTLIITSSLYSRKMMRDNNGIFNKGNIGSYIIFRDSLFNNNYYCTDEFVDFVKQNSITGLKFTCAGIAK